MEEFWLIWCDSGGAPSFKHWHETGAREEAERLARANRGKTYWVMKSQAAVTEPLPPLTWTDAQPPEVPF